MKNLLPLKKILIWGWGICVPGWLSCEKEVQVNLKDGESRLVVEGVVETGLPPYLTLTRSIGFLSRIDMKTLEDNYVHDARITVSDGTQTVELREYALTLPGSAYSFYFYSVDSSDPGARDFKGRERTAYALRIEHEGKVYESVTYIPGATPIDTLWAEKTEFAPKGTTEAYTLHFRYTDPDTFGNYIRYFTRVNSGEFRSPVGGSVFNDEIVNGTVVNATLNPRYHAGEVTDMDSLGKVFPGDTIIVKWCAVERPVYEFWNSYEFAEYSVGNPFSSPLNLRSNIRGGALGVWSGYAPSFHTIVIAGE